MSYLAAEADESPAATGFPKISLNLLIFVATICGGFGIPLAALIFVFAYAPLDVSNSFLPDCLVLTTVFLPITAAIVVILVKRALRHFTWQRYILPFALSAFWITTFAVVNHQINVQCGGMMSCGDKPF